MRFGPLPGHYLSGSYHAKDVFLGSVGGSYPVGSKLYYLSKGLNGWEEYKSERI